MASNQKNELVYGLQNKNSIAYFSQVRTVVTTMASFRKNAIKQ